MIELRLQFYDGNGAPVSWRKWTTRDGVVMLPKDASQLRIGIGGEVHVVEIARTGYNHLGSRLGDVHATEESAKYETTLYPADSWETTITTKEVKNDA